MNRRLGGPRVGLNTLAKRNLYFSRESKFVGPALSLVTAVGCPVLTDSYNKQVTLY